MGMNRRDRLRVSVASSQHTADLLFALSSSHVDDEIRIVAMRVGLSSAHICVPRQYHFMVLMLNTYGRIGRALSVGARWLGTLLSGIQRPVQTVAGLY